MAISVTPLEIPDVLLLQPQLHEDERGYFFEAWNDADFTAATGCSDAFVQDNHSRSSAGVVRGLHYQLPNPQGKLVRVTLGSAFVVAVDVRRSSPTFGGAVSVELTASNFAQLWLPPGFAHGFLSLEDPTDVLYKVTAYFAPECDRELRWNDPALAVAWPITNGAPLMSEKDRMAPLLADAVVYD